MATLPASITVMDGATPPVSITFSAIASDSGTVVFADKRKAAKSFWPKITVTFDGEKASRTSDHVGFRVVYPMTKIVDGVEVVYANALYDRGRFVLPSGMTQADRKHMSAFVRNGLGVAQIKAMVDDLDPMFG